MSDERFEEGAEGGGVWRKGGGEGWMINRGIRELGEPMREQNRGMREPGELMREQGAVELLEEENRVLREQNKDLTRRLDMMCTDMTRFHVQAVAANNQEKAQLQRQLSSLLDEKREMEHKWSGMISEHALLVKQLELFVTERDSAIRENEIIMSERDTVHKELNELHDKVHNLSRTNLELKERLGGSGRGGATLGVVESRSRSLSPGVCKEQAEGVGRTDAVEEGRRERRREEENKEIERMRRDLRRLEGELMDAVQELDNQKNQREFALRERDKVLKEREMLSVTCEQLIRERDTAVSEHLTALSRADDINKQRSDAVRQLRQIQEKYEECLREKRQSAAVSCAVSESSAESTAVTADIQQRQLLEGQTETIQVVLSCEGLEANMYQDERDATVWGFDVVSAAMSKECERSAQALDDDDEEFYFVSDIRENSPASNVLRYGDVLLSINSRRVYSGLSKCDIYRLLCSGPKSARLVIRRIKSAQATSLSIPVSQAYLKGVALEKVFVISEVSDKLSSHHKNRLAVGDRIITINGMELDSRHHSKSEIHSYLNNSTDQVTFEIIRYSHPSSRTSNLISSSSSTFSSSGVACTPTSQSSPHPPWRSTPPGHSVGGGGEDQSPSPVFSGEYTTDQFYRAEMRNTAGTSGSGTNSELSDVNTEDSGDTKHFLRSGNKTLKTERKIGKGHSGSSGIEEDLVESEEKQAAVSGSKTGGNIIKQAMKAFTSKHHLSRALGLGKSGSTVDQTSSGSTVKKRVGGRVGREQKCKSALVQGVGEDMKGDGQTRWFVNEESTTTTTESGADVQKDIVRYPGSEDRQTAKTVLLLSNHKPNNDLRGTWPKRRIRVNHSNAPPTSLVTMDTQRMSAHHKKRPSIKDFLFQQQQQLLPPSSQQLLGPGSQQQQQLLGPGSQEDAGRFCYDSSSGSTLKGWSFRRSASARQGASGEPPTRLGSTGVELRQGSGSLLPPCHVEERSETSQTRDGKKELSGNPWERSRYSPTHGSSVDGDFQMRKSADNQQEKSEQQVSHSEHESWEGRSFYISANPGVKPQDASSIIHNDSDNVIKEMVSRKISDKSDDMMAPVLYSGTNRAALTDPSQQLAADQYPEYSSRNLRQLLRSVSSQQQHLQQFHSQTFSHSAVSAANVDKTGLSALPGNPGLSKSWAFSQRIPPYTPGLFSLPPPSYDAAMARISDPSLVPQTSQTRSGGHFSPSPLIGRQTVGGDESVSIACSSEADYLNSSRVSSSNHSILSSAALINTTSVTGASSVTSSLPLSLDALSDQSSSVESSSKLRAAGEAAGAAVRRSTEQLISADNSFSSSASGAAEPPARTSNSRIRPVAGDVREIRLERTGELLGINMESGGGGRGVFVGYVEPSSLAARAGIEIGDQLLEVCGINLRNATKEIALNVLRHCEGNIYLLVQYNPTKFEELRAGSVTSSDRSLDNITSSSLTSSSLPTSAHYSLESSPTSPRLPLTRPPPLPHSEPPPPHRSHYQFSPVELVTHSIPSSSAVTSVYGSPQSFEDSSYRGYPLLGSVRNTSDTDEERIRGHQGHYIGQGHDIGSRSQSVHSSDEPTSKEICGIQGHQVMEVGHQGHHRAQGYQVMEAQIGQGHHRGQGYQAMEAQIGQGHHRVQGYQVMEAQMGQGHHRNQGYQVTETQVGQSHSVQGLQVREAQVGQGHHRGQGYQAMEAQVGQGHHGGQGNQAMAAQMGQGHHRGQGYQVKEAQVGQGHARGQGLYQKHREEGQKHDVTDERWSRYNSGDTYSSLPYSHTDRVHIPKISSKVTSTPGISVSPAPGMTRSSVSSLTSPDGSTISRLSQDNECRQVSVRRADPSEPVGLTLVGGNAVGIFVKFVSPRSVFAEAKGLRIGDEILRYNEVDFKGVTLETAVSEINNYTEHINCIARFNISRFGKIQDKQDGDGFFVLSHYNHRSSGGASSKTSPAPVGPRVMGSGGLDELSFSKGDILYVDNTMYGDPIPARGGTTGLWRAWTVDENGKCVKCGVVSYHRARRRDDGSSSLVHKRSPSDDPSMTSEVKVTTSNSNRSLGQQVRRSFFRRSSRKQNRTGSKDSSSDVWSVSDASANSSDTINTHDDLRNIPLLQELKKVDSSILRPVMLIGPFAEPIINKLSSESGDKFIRYERGENETDETLMRSVQEIIRKGRHCLLNLAPEMFDKFQRSGIFPIVLFIKYKSFKNIKDVKDARFIGEKLCSKAAKELHDQYQDVETKHKRIIADVIPGDNLTTVCTRIKSSVDKEQRKILWITATGLHIRPNK